jgi:hypothetical protein
MPRFCDRQKLINECITFLKVKCILNEENTQEFSDVLEILIGVLNTGFLNPKTQIWKNGITYQNFILQDENSCMENVRKNKDFALREMFNKLEG